MKKILFMVSSMNIGGVEKSLLSLLATIPQGKYDITVLTLEKKGGFLEFIPDWIKVEEADWFPRIKPIIMQSPYQTLSDFRSSKKYIQIPSFLCAYVKDRYLKDRYGYYKYILKSIPQHPVEYDVAIAYAGPTEIIDAYIGHKVKARKKVSWVHFDVSQIMINQKLYANLYQKFNKIFTVSHQAKQKLIEVFPSTQSKVEVFSNIISTQLINQLAQHPLSLDEEYKGTKIVTVGRLSKEKGQDLAIKVLARLREEGYLVRWYAIGEGGSRGDYEEQIKAYGLEENFKLLGATANPYPYMKKSDIYVQISRHEGFCLTLAEAKCLNKPIITTDFTGASEQIKNNITGFVVPVSEESIYKQIKYLLDYEAERERIAKELSKENVDTTQVVQKLYHYIEEGSVSYES